VIQTLLWIAAGGALGAVARFLVSSAVITWAGDGFPWNTLTVNVIGSFAIGALFAGLSELPWFHTIARPFFIVGFLGAFTTFSAFSLESLVLIEDGRAWLAGVYAVTSAAGCMAAAWLGVRVVGSTTLGL
jgi:CrcB protein